MEGVETIKHKEKYLEPNKTSKFEWTLNNIRIENIILTKNFSRSFSSTSC